MEIFDYSRELRATIADGRLLNKNNTLIGFINEDGSAGDDKESFVGEINEDGQISDADNNLLGSVDQGTAEMKRAEGSHFCTIRPGGDIYDHIDSFKGHVDNFTFHKLKMVAAYIFFFDQNLVDPKSPSKVVESSPEEENVTADLPPPPAPEPIPDIVTDLPPLTLAPPVRKVSVEDRAYKNYRVGDFKTLPGGKENLLEIFDCDCPLSQLSVRLEKEGKQVVFQRTIQSENNRKQQVQRFTVPYVLCPERVNAQYFSKRDGGTLSLLLIKPDPSAGGGSGAQAGEFTKFIIKQVPESQGKVTMKPSQTKEYFLFEATGDPKFETEVIGELSDGDQIKFHSITTDLDAGVRKKATQTFSLPLKITLEHVELEDGGRKVKVHLKKQSSSASTTTTSPTAQVQPDVDIIIVEA